MLRQLLSLATLGACSFNLHGSSIGSDAADAATDGAVDSGTATDAAADATVDAAIAWYGTGWMRRRKLAIDPTRVGSGGVTSFPVLVSRSSDIALRDQARADGNDILFTAADGTTKLSHEIERYTSSTGALIAWVKVPSISSTEPTILYMYFGNPAAADQQDAVNVWDPTFRGVWHLDQTTGGPGAIEDSTSNANHGTDRNGPLLGGAGQIGRAVTFVAGGTDLLDMGTGSTLSFGTGDFSVSAWIRPTDGNLDWQAIVARVSDASPWAGWALQIAPTNDNVNMWIDQTDNAASFAVAIGAWSHVTWTRSGGTSRLHVNGTQTATGVSTADVNVPTRPLLMGFSNGWNDFRGSVDEVRIAAVARSAAGIVTSYNNESVPTMFLSSVGPDEAAP